MKLTSFDSFNGGVALSFIGATVGGMTIQDGAACAALLYSALLIAQKLWQFWRWLRFKPVIP